MSSAAAAAAMERGIRTVFADADCITVPMADGGEGTVDALVAARGGEHVETTVHDPLGRAIQARYGLVRCENLAIIEIAAAAGLDLIATTSRDPRRTSTFGVGELISDALNRGARRFIVGLGGSATNDGGAGMLQALGTHLLDAQGDELPPGGMALARLDRIDLATFDQRLATSNFEIASDVTNPLLGPNGASAIFGPQKGADDAAVAELDSALTIWASVVASTTGRDVARIPGSGAAGGLGAAFLAFFNSEIRRGVEVVMAATHFADQIVGADYVFTGEGSIDSQTASGKTLLGVAEVARQLGVPVLAFAGRIGEDTGTLFSLGLGALVPIIQGASDLPRALADGPTNLERAAATACRLLALGHQGATKAESFRTPPANEHYLDGQKSPLTE